MLANAKWRLLHGSAVLTVALVATATAVLGEVTPSPPRPSAGCTHATGASGRGMPQTITVDGAQRSYILDVPTTAVSAGPAPLLVDFHGFGHSGTGVWRVSKFKDVAEQERFITVYPDGVTVRFTHDGKEYVGPGWDIRRRDGNPDLAFVTALLDHLEATYCVDRNRIFATGFSNGAFFSHLLGCVMADRVAAIAPVSGGQRPEPCQPPRGVPVLIFHGRHDELIRVDDGRAARDAWVATNGCHDQDRSGCERHTACRDDATVEYCEGDFTHRWPEPATVAIWEFFRSHPMTGDGRSPTARPTSSTQ